MVVYSATQLVVLVNSVVFIAVKNPPVVEPRLFAIGNTLAQAHRRIFDGQLDEFMWFSGTASMRQVIDMRYAATLGNVAWAPLQLPVMRLWQDTFREMDELAGQGVRQGKCFMDGCLYCSASARRHD